MTYIYESFEDTLLFAESIGWVEPYVDLWDHNAADDLEFEALEFIEKMGYRIVFSQESA